MSHFNLAVISDGTKSLDEMLAPFNEQAEEPEYCEFANIEEECREKYENGTEEGVRVVSTGEILSPYDDVFLVKISEEEYHTRRSNGERGLHTRYQDGQYSYYGYEYGENELGEFPLCKIYDTFEEYMESEGYTKDEKMEAYGYWFNPNAKYDWWEIGGRWRGMLKATRGERGFRYFGSAGEEKEGYYDIAKIKDVDFSLDQDAYKRAIRFWEVVVEGSPLQNGEKDEDFCSYWKVEYYRERYGNKEQYAQEIALFSTFAVLTVDGEWHECGKMGWFGCSDESADEAREWYNNWYDMFIKNANPEHDIIIVDCHI